MMECAALAQGNADHPTARLLSRFADRLRHLARLARAIAGAALAVADHHDRGKAEAAAALHHLGDAVDADELLDEFAVLAVASALARPVAIAAATLPTLAAAATARGSFALRLCCHGCLS